ncbi:MAG TPA: hypothetical protein DDY14_13000 [Chromatiaceae bacterium]|jgi:hypothetical protein|nr:MAG: hypothetical protein N838_14870 [Thiohalocapsa sp. PB-PSB1]HBG96198.1 hypothetical protein [Chromatiaceae bacterium]HCS89848.1 hypothetical protein [Chromatiaceae bacterium]
MSSVKPEPVFALLAHFIILKRFLLRNRPFETTRDHLACLLIRLDVAEARPQSRAAYRFAELNQEPRRQLVHFSAAIALYFSVL